MNFKIETPVLNFKQNLARRAQTNAIVIHHLVGDLDVHRTHAAHLAKGWSGIGYNFHISKNGVISEGRGMGNIGAHTEGRNADTIGIGVEGNFETIDRKMSDIQFNALVWLLRCLREAYGNIPIEGHRAFQATLCPGQHFPLAEVKSLEFRGGEVVENTAHWAQKYLDNLVKKGIIENNEDANWAEFDKPVTRGALLALIDKVTGEIK